MKKVMLLAALLAMMLVAAVPAIAQVSFELGGQAAESGEVEQEFEVANTGANSNQCVGFQGFGNTGNLQNSQGALQYSSEGGVAFEGGSFEFAPASGTSCEQAVQQSAAASSF